LARAEKAKQDKIRKDAEMELIRQALEQKAAVQSRAAAKKKAEKFNRKADAKQKTEQEKMRKAQEMLLIQRALAQRRSPKRKL
jgi:hypothetical protein